MFAPLYKQLKKNAKFEWGEEQNNAFEAAKAYLCSHPILCIFNRDERCYIYTDASRAGIGGVLKQRQQDGTLRPVAYFSRKLRSYELNYSVPELECLAIIECVICWHHYVYDNEFTVITDHMPLKWLNSIKKPSARLFNWSLKLSQYKFVVVYQKGKNNVEADSLSRSPVTETVQNEEHLKIVNILQKDELIVMQKQLTNTDHLKKVDGIFVKQTPLFKKIVIPNAMRNE
ncbi:Retrotransposable element Tf2 protein type 1-like protein, partial [Leptotrombidium deliense]